MNLTEIEERLAGITPGEWVEFCPQSETALTIQSGLRTVATIAWAEPVSPQRSADARFIAHAPADIERLLGEVRRLQLWIASDVARARGLALALSEARDAEIPEQHQASREIAAEIVSLLEHTEET